MHAAPRRKTGLLLFGDQNAVGAVLAAVYAMNFEGIRIAIEIEVMPQHIHFEDRFLRGRGLDKEALLADDVVLILGLVGAVIGRHSFDGGLADTGIEALAVFDDPAGQHFDGGVEGVFHALGGFLRAHHEALILDGQLDGLPILLNGDGDLSLHIGGEELVQLGQSGIDALEECVLEGNLTSGTRDFHTNASFICNGACRSCYEYHTRNPGELQEGQAMFTDCFCSSCEKETIGTKSFHSAGRYRKKSVLAAADDQTIE